MRSSYLIKKIIINKMKNYVKIINIIDRSGSMNTMIDSAINGFNAFLEDQKSVEGDALVSTIQFSNLYNVLYENLDIQKVEVFNKNNYQPGGSTALYDAIGKTINNEIDLLGKLSKEERPDKTLCVILTDGEENSSVEFSQQKIKELISEMKESFKWEFIFLAANEEASFTAQAMGISKGNSYAFANTSSGLKDAYMGASHATRSYRSSKSVSMSSLMDDYKQESTDSK
jgi:hypothetical protein